jgi:hypothetical protein
MDDALHLLLHFIVERSWGRWDVNSNLSLIASISPTHPKKFQKYSASEQFNVNQQRSAETVLKLTELRNFRSLENCIRTNFFILYKLLGFYYVKLLTSLRL